VVVPYSSGFSFAWKNVAAIKNTGVELQLTTTPILWKHLQWHIITSFWANKAEVTRLDVPAFNTGAFGATLGTYRVELGKSPTQIVGIGGPDDKVDPASGLAVYGNGEPDLICRITMISSGRTGNLLCCRIGKKAGRTLT
jgi:hypothetical protein